MTNGMGAAIAKARNESKTLDAIRKADAEAAKRHKALLKTLKDIKKDIHDILKTVT
jgi:hypothetical protein